MTCGVRTVTARFWRIGLLLLLAIGFIGTTGCSGVNSLFIKSRMMTPDEEVQFGRQIAWQVEQRAELVEDAAVQNYVNAVGGRIARTAPHSDLPIRFHVVKDDTINAFAIPGGNIYVNTGLLKAADDESELAAVIAHEIGHVVRRHAAQQVSHTEVMQSIQQILMGGNSPQTAQLVTSLLARGVLFNFSREDESEADTIAIHTLYNAGYDPRALSRLFAKLVQAYGDSGPSMPILKQVQNLSATHPSIRERITRVDQITRRLPMPRYPAVTTDLRRVQGRLKQLNMIQ